MQMKTTETRSEKSAGRKSLGYILTFVWTLLVARIVIDLVNYGTVFVRESWVTPGAWVYPAGFALIGCYARWYRTRP